MAKNPNKRSKAASWDAPMTAAMKFFLVGCLAELYLLVVRSYFVHGTAVQMIAWYDHYLRYFLAGGAVLLIAGAAIFFLSRAKKLQVKPVVSEMSLYALVLGAFVALASALALWNMATVSLLTTYRINKSTCCFSKTKGKKTVYA